MPTLLGLLAVLALVYWLYGSRLAPAPPVRPARSTPAAHAPGGRPTPTPKRPAAAVAPVAAVTPVPQRTPQLGPDGLPAGALRPIYRTRQVMDQVRKSREDQP